MSCRSHAEQCEHPFLSALVFFIYRLENLLARVAFEVSDRAAQVSIATSNNNVHVVAHNDKGKNFKSFFLLAKA